MSSEMSGEQMQARIISARRDAESLKDRIKSKKDELADTSCESPADPISALSVELCHGLGSYPLLTRELTHPIQYEL